MSLSVTIRVARVEDAVELLKIYGYYVENTAITFEYDVPSVEEFQGRIVHTLQTGESLPGMPPDIYGSKPSSKYSYLFLSQIFLKGN
jgi:hypothetical protein